MNEPKTVDNDLIMNQIKEAHKLLEEKGVFTKGACVSNKILFLIVNGVTAEAVTEDVFFNESDAKDKCKRINKLGSYAVVSLGEHLNSLLTHFNKDLHWDAEPQQSDPAHIGEIVRQTLEYVAKNAKTVEFGG